MATTQLRALLAAAALAASSPSSATPPVRLAVTAASGPVTPAMLRARLPRLRLAACQNTWQGATLTLALRVGVDGAVSIDATRARGESGSLYAPCVRGELRRVRLAPQPAPSALRVTVAFPALGLPPPTR